MDLKNILIELVELDAAETELKRVKAFTSQSYVQRRAAQLKERRDELNLQLVDRGLKPIRYRDYLAVNV